MEKEKGVFQLRLPFVQNEENVQKCKKGGFYV
jgi:hypothetical protein